MLVNLLGTPFIFQSCPAINIYSAKNLEYGLTAAAKNFCEQEVDVSNKEVRLMIEEKDIFMLNFASKIIIILCIT